VVDATQQVRQFRKSICNDWFLGVKRNHRTI